MAGKSINKAYLESDAVRRPILVDSRNNEQFNSTFLRIKNF
jgi:hypothetical protein